MTENGQPILRIGTMGRRLMAIGDEDDNRQLPASQVDVVRTQNAWHLIDSQYRDAEGKVSAERLPEYESAAEQFVCGIMKYDLGSISGAEAIAFLAQVEREVAALRPFFDVRSPEEQNSRASFTPRYSE